MIEGVIIRQPCAVTPRTETRFGVEVGVDLGAVYPDLSNLRRVICRQGNPVARWVARQPVGPLQQQRSFEPFVAP
jgi:hypothetical protein